MDTRICIYCHHETTGDDHDYMRCQKCGAATYPLSYREKILEMKNQVLRFTRCGMADGCIQNGNYRPECEDLVFTPNCLVTIQEDMLYLTNQLRKIQDRLGIPSQSLQQGLPELDE